MKKKITFVLTFLLFSSTFFSQECSFLNSQNGFRNIKLGENIKNYPEFELKNDNNLELFKLSFNSETDYVYVGNENDEISSTKILFIYLNVKDKKIERIHIVTQKVEGLYYILKNAYGETSTEYGKKWIWRTENIECSIEGDDNNIPGYHIIYNYLSEDRKILNERKTKRSKEAQAEL
ncbi:hypothetical protein [Flavobacterium sp.]|uniref:hypothetical protein n=1 Tax=Flavobacterium sp. TaxID=239 RepID=UPI0025BB4083|nr:hypothetical protein [Flavobacterium sp.]MBA4155393.1 hypothetical protein [Flavobacterium sp.]